MTAKPRGTHNQPPPLVDKIGTREATVSDYAFLQQLHHAAYREVVTRQFGAWLESDQDEWFVQGLDAGECRIITLAGTPVGAISVHEAPDHILLAELQVLPEHQNRGIGSSLLTAELERAAARGLPVLLRVLRESRARALYERHGFSITGETENHYLMTWVAGERSG